MPVADFKIPDVPPREQYVATAGQINFPIPFRFFEEGDVEVYLNENLLPENPNSYTITGAGTNANGDLDFDVGQLEDTVVTIVRNSAIERTVNFINSGDWRAQNVNDQFNRLVTFIQEVKLKAVDLALSLPLTSLLSVLTIPDEGATANASKVWMWDATGTQLINGPSAQNIFDANETLEDLGDIADEVEINRVATEAARDGAINAQAAAEAAANSALWSNVIFLTSANSPYIVTSANAGDLLSVNSTGGAITINLPQISGIPSPFNLGIKKTSADANVITINRAGTDTIDGATNKTLTLQNQGTTLVADTDPAPDIWTSADFGTATTVADGSLPYAKLAATAIASVSDIVNLVASKLVNAATLQSWFQAHGKTLMASQAMTSGSSKDFAIPSWVNEFTVVLSEVSTNGSSAVVIQLGDAGGIETTGYSGSSVSHLRTNSASGVTNAGAAGFITDGEVFGAAAKRSGRIPVSRVNGNLWVAAGIILKSDDIASVGVGGSKTLSQPLTTVRLATANGTDVFDGGEATVIY